MGLTPHRDLCAYKLCWRLGLLRRRCRFRLGNWPLLATLRLSFPETVSGPLNLKAHHWAAQRYFRFDLARKRRGGAGFGRVRQRAQSCAAIGRSVWRIGSQLTPRPEAQKPLQWAHRAGLRARRLRPPWPSPLPALNETLGKSTSALSSGKGSVLCGMAFAATKWS